MICFLALDPRNPEWINHLLGASVVTSVTIKVAVAGLRELLSG
jgi:hypothetical protein